MVVLQTSAEQWLVGEAVLPLAVEARQQEEVLAVQQPAEVEAVLRQVVLLLAVEVKGQHLNQRHIPVPDIYPTGPDKHRGLPPISEHLLEYLSNGNRLSGRQILLEVPQAGQRLLPA